MDLYMAGGISGNCKPMWCDFVTKGTSGGMEVVDLYLAGGQGHHRQDNLAGRYEAGNKIDLMLLESYYYADKWIEAIIPKLKKFLLDSGAFTFMTSHKGSVDWNEYLEGYIDFINRNNVDLFFELDIDSIVGYENVLKLRKKLEQGTGKRCIPVWHKSRGKEEFLRMCDEYEYVSIGGIVSKEISRQEYRFFPWFINEAHKRGAKIHGLGFTNLEGIRKYKFDSVDSTSWTTGNRFGSIYRFNGRTMEKFDKKDGQRLSDSRAVAINNFNEWVKFQKYAERCL
jgi:hypothetical protein